MIIAQSRWPRYIAIVLTMLGASACVVSNGMWFSSDNMPSEGQQIMTVSLKQVAEMSIESYNPKTVIDAVNALRPLGKEAALKQIEDYLKTAKGDHTGLFWVLRTLFDVPQGKGFPPVLIGAPTIPPPSSADKFPRFPIVIVKDVPLLVVDGYTLGGLPESVQAHVDYFRSNGTLRQSALDPSTSASAVSDELLKQWKQVYGDEYTSQVTQTIKSQISRMNK